MAALTTKHMHELRICVPGIATKHCEDFLILVFSLAFAFALAIFVFSLTLSGRQPLSVLLILPSFCFFFVIGIHSTINFVPLNFRPRSSWLLGQLGQPP